MATHTDSGKGAHWRKFSISRENGQVDKEGRPYFFEWVKELPTQVGKRKFETRETGGKQRHYELFAALDGYLIDVREEMKDLGKGLEAWLVLHLIDLDDEYVIEVGRIDERYAMDIMKRLLNPNFSPSQKLRVAPYAMKDDKGRWNIGISAYSGVDKLEHSQTSEFLRGIPRADSREWKGKTEWDFSPVSKWLFDKVAQLVVPNLRKDPISVPSIPAHAADSFSTSSDADFPKHEVAQNFENNAPDFGEDLPF